MFKRSDLQGQVFGRLVVVKFDRMHRKGPKCTIAMWECRCECGNAIVVRSSDLRSGNTRSCGCFQSDIVKALRTSHGHTTRKSGVRSETKIYGVWLAMRARCKNPKNADFKSYGGRGIKVCERWQIFENFLADMGEPKSGESIDRQDTNGDYEPGNCRWATAAEQARNKRSTQMLTVDGRTQCITDWAREVGVPHQRIRKRVASGWSPREAILAPAGQRRIQGVAHG